MNNCPKCGYPLEEDSNLTKDGLMRYHCPQCLISHYVSVAQEEESDPISQDEEVEPTSQDEGDGPQICIIIYLICFGAGIIMLRFFPLATLILFIGALVSVVTGFIKYPQNKAMKVFFWLTIAQIILAAILVITLIIICNACTNACTNACNACLNDCLNACQNFPG